MHCRIAQTVHVTAGSIWETHTKKSRIRKPTSKDKLMNAWNDLPAKVVDFRSVVNCMRCINEVDFLARHTQIIAYWRGRGTKSGDVVRPTLWIDGRTCGEIFSNGWIVEPEILDCAKPNKELRLKSKPTLGEIFPVSWGQQTSPGSHHVWKRPIISIVLSALFEQVSEYNDDNGGKHSTLMPRSRMLGSRNFRVRFSEFRVPSVPVNSEVGTRKFIEIQVNK